MRPLGLGEFLFLLGIRSRLPTGGGEDVGRAGRRAGGFAGGGAGRLQLGGRLRRGFGRFLRRRLGRFGLGLRLGGVDYLEKIDVDVVPADVVDPLAELDDARPLMLTVFT